MSGTVQLLSKQITQTNHRCYDNHTQKLQPQSPPDKKKLDYKAQGSIYALKALHLYPFAFQATSVDLKAKGSICVLPTVHLLCPLPLKQQYMALTSPSHWCIGELRISLSKSFCRRISVHDSWNTNSNKDHNTNQNFKHGYLIWAQVRLRTEALRTQSLTQLGFKLMTSRSWQYISCHWDACSNHLAIRDYLSYTR